MNLEFELVDFNYRVIDVKTVQSKDSRFGALSFLEGKRDIPFPIRRAYWITETEADLHRGFHAHKLNCQLLFCPHGCIDIIVDDGDNKRTVTLDKPGKGLILMPGLWREMVWRESGSVLCVLASEYYDEQEYIRDYNEFLAYCQKYRATVNHGTDANTLLTERLQHCY
ncbi:MAG: FdtA/QdtA family cupin domain-containing protein [Oscillospiraceae bacterium]|nr:FdtA/QdtA family cupin domain-containing protein [Oscillospiraceae bacterium]